jgi:hypothetical protein
VTLPPGVLVAERLEDRPELRLRRPDVRDLASIVEYGGRRVYLLKDRRFVASLVDGHRRVNGTGWHEWERHFVLRRGETPVLQLAEVLRALRGPLIRAGVRPREIAVIESVLRLHVPHTDTDVLTG